MVLGLDIDGCIRDFNAGYNHTFKKYFPEHSNKVLDQPTHWNCFYDYGWNEIISKKLSIPIEEVTHKHIEEHSLSWLFNEASQEVFENSPAYDVLESINLLKKFCEANGIKLKFITHQVGDGLKYTLSWLIKHNLYLKEYCFVDYAKEKWKHCDVMIDDSPTVLGTKPDNKFSIKVKHLYNKKFEANYSIKDLNDTENLFKFLLEIKSKIK